VLGFKVQVLDLSFRFGLISGLVSVLVPVLVLALVSLFRLWFQFQVSGFRF